MENNNNNSTGKKVKKSFALMLKQLIRGSKPVENVLEEEAIQTPLKTVLKNFARNKLGVIGVIGMVAILCFSLIGSLIVPMDDNYIELTNQNLKPGQNYLKYPTELNDKTVTKIVSGVSFSAAITDDGEFYMWGTEPNKEQENVSGYIFDIPEEVKNNKIVDIVAGGNHMLAIDENDIVYGWGYYGNDQTIIPDDVAEIFADPDVTIKQMAATSQWTGLLGTDGNFYIWGSSQAESILLIPSSVKGRIVQVAEGDNNVALLLDDGSIYIIGDRGTEFVTLAPPELLDGSVKIVDIAATNRNVLAIDENGEVYLWGSSEDGLSTMPEFSGNVVAVDSGYKNFVAILESGETVVWGSDDLGQLDAPSSDVNLTNVYADYFQFYGIDEEGEIHAWGNDGYLMGTDQYGRDVFTRIIHGGKISLTVGAIAVIISTTIALFVGLTAGYFGKWVDHLLMRITDVFSAIPFYPIAITLSYAIGFEMSESQRINLIMVILGLLGWMPLARLIRAQLLLEREKDFVLAAKALGIRQNVIMWRHILPNVFNLIIVNITLAYASSLLSEAALSFIGFGVTEPTPSWGNMLTTAQDTTVIEFYWWRWIIPAIFVISAALSANLIGDALREAMDPRSNEK